jgi:hypothetical protein
MLDAAIANLAFILVAMRRLDRIGVVDRLLVLRARRLAREYC